jgi:hypothetical protein
LNSIRRYPASLELHTAMEIIFKVNSSANS